MGTTPYPNPSVETETRLRAAGESGWLGPGDVEIDPGLGVVGAHRSGRMVIDTIQKALSDPRGLFWPGPAAIDTVGQLPLHGAAERAVVAAVVVNCITAPGTGTDASNHWALRLSGQALGQVDVALSTAGQRLFTFDQLAPTVQGVLGASGSTWTGPGFGSKNKGYMTEVTMTADVIATGLRTRLNIDSSWPTNADGNRIARGRLYLLNADRSELLAATPVVEKLYPDNAGKVNFDAALDRSVELLQNSTYRIAWEDQRAGAAPDTDYYTRGERSTSGSTGSLTKASNEVWINDGGAWDDPTDDGPWTQDESGEAAPVVGVLGRPDGVALEGSPVDVEWIEVGTGATPPEDLNVLLYYLDG